MDAWVVSATEPSVSQNSAAILGYLLLRDGHAIPLQGISPDQLKAGAKDHVPNVDADPIKHQRRLTAIVDRLGFRGDFGDFVHSGYPQLCDFLTENGCTHQARLFPDPEHTAAPNRRQLADRLFEAALPRPERVFLGYDLKWDPWWPAFLQPESIAQHIKGHPVLVLRRLQELRRNFEPLLDNVGFLDDHLIWGPVTHLVNRRYGPGAPESFGAYEDALKTFRAVIDASDHGWVDVLMYNERLAVLRADDGAWDIVWRALRAGPPPTDSSVVGHYNLEPEDLPSSLLAKLSPAQFIYYRQEVWDEEEAHIAEAAFYERGGNMAGRRLTTFDDVRIQWLEETGVISPPPKADIEIPPRFVVVGVGDVALSEYVTVGEFRQMADESGYFERREGEDWTRANVDAEDDDPVCATWNDAIAFCAWIERQLNVPVRLPKLDELRAVHPFYSDFYEDLSNLDFPWEKWPPRPLSRFSGSGAPRKDVPSAASWSEPRFTELGPGEPEFPTRDTGFKSRKRWISDFPPKSSWTKPLPTARYNNLTFIDAWDAYEWCHQTGYVHGRFWEGPFARWSWGAYKNSKITFRLAIESKGVR